MNIKIKSFLFVALLAFGFLPLASSGQTIVGNNVQIYNQLSLKGHKITDISTDSSFTNPSDVALPTQLAVYNFVMKSTGSFIPITRFGADGSDLLSDRENIQKTVDFTSQHGGTVLIPKGDWYLDSTVVLPSNTTILCQEGAVIHLMDSANTEMLSNLHKTTPDNLTIIDSNINVTGGVWMANGDNQAKYKPDITPVSGFLFSGIKNCKFTDVYLYNSQTYAYNISNFKDLVFDKCDINQGDTLPSVLHNQDGFHFNGPGSNLQVLNSKVRTYDDAIAINADDNPGVGTYQSLGDINNVLIYNIIFDSTRRGIRLLSANHKIDNVIINSITGSTYSNFLEASSFRLLGGKGNFGSVSVSNVNINSLSAPSGKWPTYNNRFIVVYGNFNSLSLTNVTRGGSIDSNSPLVGTFYVDTPSVIKSLTINGLTSYRSDTLNLSDIAFQNGDTINNLSISSHRLFGGSDTTKNTAIDFRGLTANSVTISGANYDTLNTAIKITNSKIGSFNLSGNNALRISKAIPISSSNIDTLFISGNYFRGATRKAFSTTSSGNTINRIRAFLPVMAAPGSAAITDSIEYSYNGGNYAIKAPAGSGGGSGGVTSVNTKTGDVTITKSDIGLSDVDNTSDIAKPISNAVQAALDLKANASALSNYLSLSGGTMTGNIVMPFGSPTAPNLQVTGSTNSGLYYNSSYFGFSYTGVTKYFFQAVNNRGLVMANDMPVSWASTAGANLSAPDIFLTRKSASVLQLSNNAGSGAADFWINGKLTVAGSPSGTPGSDSILTIKNGVVSRIVGNYFAPLNSPGFIGAPTATTPAVTDSSDRLATTDFVKQGLKEKLDASFEQTIRLGKGLVGDSISSTVDSIYLRQKIVTSTSASSVAINADTTNIYTLTALAAGVTFANPTGIPKEGDLLFVRIKDNGTSQTIAWDTAFRGSTDIPLPSVTTASKTMYLKFMYNNVDSKWDLLQKVNGF